MFFVFPGSRHEAQPTTTPQPAVASARSARSAAAARRRLRLRCGPLRRRALRRGRPLAWAAAEKQLSYQDDHKAFLEFTSEVASTLATEKKNLEIIKAGGDPNAKKKGKKK